MRQILPIACLSLVAATGCVSNLEPQEVRVFVMKESTNATGTCYDACGELPPAELELPMCSTTVTQCELVSGWDRVRVVAHFGAFRLEESVELPSTKIELVVDGAPLAVKYDAALSAGDRSLEQQRLAIADFTVPPLLGKHLEVRALTGEAWTESTVRIPIHEPELVLRPSSGCEARPCALVRSTGQVEFLIEAPVGLASKSGQLQLKQDGILTATRTVPLTTQEGRAVGRHTEKVPVSGSQWEAIFTLEGFVSNPVSFALATPGLNLIVADCADPSTCSAVRGTGAIEYFVTAPGGFIPPTVTIEARTDGNAFTSVATPSFEPRDLLMVARGTLPVPISGDRWQIVGVVAGEATPIAELSLTPPELQLVTPNCPVTGACQLEEGVGTLELTVTAPRGFRAESVAVLESLDGYAGAGGVGRFVDTAEVRVARVELPVPEGGTSWSVRAEAGVELAGQQTLSLVPPSVEVQVQECAGMDPCVLPANSAVTIEVSAPAGLRNPTAAVEYRRNGVSIGEVGAIDLATIEGDRRSGRRVTTLPDSEGDVWQAIVRVGRFSWPAPAVQLSAAVP